MVLNVKLGAVRVSKWLLFEENPPKTKTRVFRVISRNQGRVLGEIAWFWRWRQYAFFPNPETVFNAECLTDIKEFCEGLMAERKEPTP